MLRRTSLALLTLGLCGCKPPEARSRMKAILGAVLMDGTGGPPLSDSILVVGGGKIQAAGARSEIPVPSEADRINGAGKFVVPAMVDICGRVDPADEVHASGAQEARDQVAKLAQRRPAAIHVGGLPAAVTEAALEAAREAGVPVTGHFTKQAEARLLVDHGASRLVGAIGDTEALDGALLARWRDLRVVVAPALARAGVDLDLSKRNTLKLFQAGVPLAVASLGGDLVREAELLAEAGVPALDVMVAATANGARCLGEYEKRGVLLPGRTADLLVLSASPGSDIRNLRQVALRMAEGEWVN